MFKVLTIQRQAEVYHVFRSGVSTIPLDQASATDLVSFLECILFVDCGLCKQVSGGTASYLQ